MIDTAIDCFSGMTSQPSMGAVVNSLQGGPYDTGLNPRAICDLNEYWGEVRRGGALFFLFMYFIDLFLFIFFRFDNCMLPLRVE